MQKCQYYLGVCVKQVSRMNFMEGSTVHPTEKFHSCMYIFDYVYS